MRGISIIFFLTSSISSSILTCSIALSILATSCVSKIPSCDFLAISFFLFSNATFLISVVVSSEIFLPCFPRANIASLMAFLASKFVVAASFSFSS